MQGRVLLLMTILAVTPVQAFAGFELSDNGQAIDITNMPSTSGKAVLYTPQKPAEEPGTLKKASRPESDPTAPALQIFNERYLPDTVKKKYNIKDSWYDEGRPTSSMPSASVQPMTEPLVVEDGPAASSAPAPLTEKDMGPAPSQPSEQSSAAAAPQSATAAAVPASESMAEPPVALAAVAPYAKIETWRARKGEPVREVLKRWSQREGTELMWASGDAPNLPKDFSYVGPLEKAVSALIQSTGVPLYTQYRSDGLTPVMMSPASAITTDTASVPEPAVTIDAAVAPQAAAPVAPVMPGPQQAETRWFALSGASLPEVLQVWADKEGATLLWQASTTYALKDSVSQVGHFEDAIFKALSQYDNDEMRPVGQLYTDPVTGGKVLLIRNDTPS